jgi:hypothetical protein
MTASVRLGWRVAAIAAFAATAALAVSLTQGGSTPAALTSAKHVTKQRAAGGAPRCATSRLRISVGTGTGTSTGASTGTSTGASTGASPLRVTRYRLEFTNVSGVKCTLSGYPEVAAYRGDGAQIGNEAGRDTSMAARHIVLAPGASAHAAITANVSRGPCRPVDAAGLRVVPPGQKAASYIRHTLRACSAAGPRAPVFLRVRAVQP